MPSRFLYNVYNISILLTMRMCISINIILMEMGSRSFSVWQRMNLTCYHWWDKNMFLFYVFRLLSVSLSLCAFFFSTSSFAIQWTLRMDTRTPIVRFWMWWQWHWCCALVMLHCTTQRFIHIYHIKTFRVSFDGNNGHSHIWHLLLPVT